MIVPGAVCLYGLLSSFRVTHGPAVHTFSSPSLHTGLWWTSPSPPPPSFRILVPHKQHGSCSFRINSLCCGAGRYNYYILFLYCFVKRNGDMMLSFKGMEISFHLLVLRKSRFKPKIIRYRIVNLLVIFFWNIVKTM